MFYFRLFLNVSFEWGFSKEFFYFLFPVQICVSIINRLLEVVLYKLGHILHRYWRTEEGGEIRDIGESRGKVTLI